ncbi:TetR/AcrR family transcriptional regulator [Paenibacillus aestuarii]|uniref:TetR/AcrR family transcriptional regulator n=1 Tax=Paenibacillus aestuarii TaxID=516965 RepID=A0ABW0KGC1_9BACL|nr:TetR/AcrR family transcriptional regulator [Paenibacillus aestuarii]
MKQEERRFQTRNRLLEATKALIHEKGCHSITMKDIMEKSQLSKGAIFHYVKSKDEIFALVLQERLEETNQRFMAEVEVNEKTFAGPMHKIMLSLSSLEASNEVTNMVLVYLLGKENEPAVAEVLQRFYERSVQLSRTWIVTGQQHGVIPQSVNADKTAEMFVLISIGMRVRSSFPAISASFTSADFSDLIVNQLQPE